MANSHGSFRTTTDLKDGLLFLQWALFIFTFHPQGLNLYKNYYMSHPRFLFSNPQNTKTVGPFITVAKGGIHGILKVNGTVKNFSITWLSVFNFITQSDNEAASNAVLIDAKRWLIAQIQSGEVYW